MHTVLPVDPSSTWVGSWESTGRGVVDDSDWSKCFVQYDGQTMERGLYQSIQIFISSMASLALTLRSDLSRSLQ